MTLSKGKEPEEPKLGRSAGINPDLVRLCLAAMSDPTELDGVPKTDLELVILALCSSKLAVRLTGQSLQQLYRRHMSNPAMMTQARELQNACFAALKSSKPTEWSV
jgi:hypothetical protein